MTTPSNEEARCCACKFELEPCPACCAKRDLAEVIAKHGPLIREALAAANLPTPAIRDKALEEAAIEADRWVPGVSQHIRALKGTPPQEEFGRALREPALVASLPEPVPVSAHSGDGQARKQVEPECPICGTRPPEIPCPNCAYTGEKL